MATIKDVMEFFGMNIHEFSREWESLTDDDKFFFKQAVGALLGK